VADSADVIVPDLRGFGQSDKHPVDNASLTPLDRSGHFTPVERAREFAAAVAAAVTAR
jgi:pimeloyl-ACP methyl ester carboxylesterase